jgi:tetratricopeptide (TPR) repeat protein
MNLFAQGEFRFPPILHLRNEACPANQKGTPMAKHSRFVFLILILAIVTAGVISAYYLIVNRPRPLALPEPGNATYEEFAHDFFLGVAALDEEQDELALEKLTEAIQKIPLEPAAWANRGLLHLRHNQLPEAIADIGRAKELAPDSAEIEMLLGRVSEKQTQFADAAAHYRKAVERNPKDVMIRFALAEVLSMQGNPESDEEIQKHLDKILESQPYNLAVLKDYLGVSARRTDLPGFRQCVERLRQLAAHWSTDARKRLEFAEKLAAGPLPAQVPPELIQLQNLLVAERGYVRSRRAVAPSDAYVGEAVEHFLRLAPVQSNPAPPDLELAFTSGPIIGLAKGAEAGWKTIQPVWLKSGSKPAILVANSKEARIAGIGIPSLPFPGGPAEGSPTDAGVLAFDWNNDFRTDFLFAGAGGLRFFQQSEDRQFVDVTDRTGLDQATLQADYFGAWAADYDLDGDLDVIAARRTGPPVVLRNNGDGTFKPIEVFSGVEAVRAFVWADFDNDGAPDAAFLDAQGKLHVFANQRSGFFLKRSVPADLEKAVAIAVADVTNDGVFDLLVLGSDGQIVRLSDREKGSLWKVGPVVRGPALPAESEPGAVVLLVADLDNNGGSDLVVSTALDTHVWLSDQAGKFQPLATSLPGGVVAAVDLDLTGRLDLLALSDSGQPVRLANQGSRGYHWQAIHAFANRQGKAEGDNRINSFAIGGEIEVRTGTHVQKQPITAPVVHFGLGERRGSDAVRILWPNGISEVKFEHPPNEPTRPQSGYAIFQKAGDQIVEAEQRLKGSCPFLFTFDGHSIEFVTDFMWSTPLGMYINAQDKGGFLQTTDWVKIRGDQLVPRNGVYDVRVTANLWETHYYDYMALMVVDHPPGTEVYVDERFFLTPTEPEVFVTEPPHPVAHAWDQDGQDVTAVVQAIDGRYLDTCGRGLFQGITHHHWVEVDLGDDAPKVGPLWLLAKGWVHPTDSSVNFAVEQGRHDRPRGLELEVPDGKGGWKVCCPALGFPAGKNKTILIGLDGIEGPGVSRRFRLRTNMEIYWDALAYARGLDSGLAHQQTLLPDRAELRFHGIVKITNADSSSPEIPHYDQLVRRGQHFRDLIGFYTRFGDVRELLAAVDDRYVIMNAGDEIAFEFRAPAGPPTGWKRDFVWVCDGWAKDGDLNTRFSKTVLPLPAHDLKTYNTPPGCLEDDPIFRRYPQDWKNYHTRFVSSEVFERGLRSFRRPQVQAEDGAESPATPR